MWGGHVLEFMVEHGVYGDINVALIIRNRIDVKDFVDKIQEIGASPLMGLTNGMHYHTVQAYSEEVLDLIEKQLSEKGYLISK